MALPQKRAWLLPVMWGALGMLSVGLVVAGVVNWQMQSAQLLGQSFGGDNAVFDPYAGQNSSDPYGYQGNYDSSASSDDTAEQPGFCCFVNEMTDMGGKGRCPAFPLSIAECTDEGLSMGLTLTPQQLSQLAQEGYDYTAGGLWHDMFAYYRDPETMQPFADPHEACVATCNGLPVVPYYPSSASASYGGFMPFPPKPPYSASSYQGGGIGLMPFPPNNSSSQGGKIPYPIPPEPKPPKPLDPKAKVLCCKPNDPQHKDWFVTNVRGDIAQQEEGCTQPDPAHTGPFIAGVIGRVLKPNEPVPPPPYPCDSQAFTGCYACSDDQCEGTGILGKFSCTEDRCTTLGQGDVNSPLCVYKDGWFGFAGSCIPDARKCANGNPCELCDADELDNEAACSATKGYCEWDDGWFGWNLSWLGADCGQGNACANQVMCAVGPAHCDEMPAQDCDYAYAGVYDGMTPEQNCIVDAPVIHGLLKL